MFKQTFLLFLFCIFAWPCHAKPDKTVQKIASYISEPHLVGQGRHKQGILKADGETVFLKHAS